MSNTEASSDELGVNTRADDHDAVPHLTTTSGFDSACTTTTEQRTGNHLLTLPPEIRNMIYEHALFMPGPRFVISYTKWIQERCYQPSLTRVCKTIRAESLPIFYSQTQFEVGFDSLGDDRRSNAWARAIASRNRSHLKQVWVQWRCWDARKWDRHPDREKFGPLVKGLEKAPMSSVESWAEWQMSGYDYYSFDCQDLDVDFGDMPQHVRSGGPARPRSWIVPYCIWDAVVYYSQLAVAALGWAQPPAR